MLATWVESVKRTGITNFLVIALDDQTGKFAPGWCARSQPERPRSCSHGKDWSGNLARQVCRLGRQGAGQPRHFCAEVPSSQRVSKPWLSCAAIRRVACGGIKAPGADRRRIHRPLDVDVVTLQDPFAFLARDSDVEGLSDGFDERTAYGALRDGALRLCASSQALPGYIDGIDDATMGWARYAQTVRIFVLNSGLFYIQPSERTVRRTGGRPLLLSSRIFERRSA